MKNFRLAGQSILVVEDEPLIAMQLRQTLEDAGAHVFAATQLPHASQLARHPDLSSAVLDYRLGNGNSAAICAVLHERGVPFVFCSGYDDMQDRWPDVPCVSKPIDGDRLVDAVVGLRDLAKAA